MVHKCLIAYLTLLALTEGKIHPPYFKAQLLGILYLIKFPQICGLFLNTYGLPIHSKLWSKLSVRV